MLACWLCITYLSAVPAERYQQTAHVFHKASALSEELNQVLRRRHLAFLVLTCSTLLVNPRPIRTFEEDHDCHQGSSGSETLIYCAGPIYLIRNHYFLCFIYTPIYNFVSPFNIYQCITFLSLAFQSRSWGRRESKESIAEHRILSIEMSLS